MKGIRWTRGETQVKGTTRHPARRLTISYRPVLSELHVSTAIWIARGRRHSPLYGSGCRSSANRFSACSKTIASARGSVMFLCVSLAIPEHWKQDLRF